MADIYVRSTDGDNADNGSTWALAKATLAGAAAIDSNGDTIYVSHAHSESSSASQTITLAGTPASPVRVICANAGAEPPTTLATSGVIATTGASNITVNGATSAYLYGLTFRAGDGTANASLFFGGDAASRLLSLEQCTLHLRTGNGTSRVNLGNNGSWLPAYIRLRDCTIELSHQAQQIYSGSGRIVWEGGSLIATGLSSSAGWFLASSRTAQWEITGVDMSGIGASSHLFAATGGHFAVLRNCRLPSSWSGNLFVSTPTQGDRVEMYNCDDGATNYRLWIEDYTGSIKHDSAVYLTANRDAGTPISHKFASSTNCNFASGRLYGPEVGAVITSAMVGVSTTATVEIVTDSATALNDDDIWLEVMYPSSSLHPLGAWASDAKSSILASGTAQTSSSAAWTGTGGFANEQKRKLTVTFTPQMEGLLTARVVMGKASTTVYVDPDVRLA